MDFVCDELASSLKKFLNEILKEAKNLVMEKNFDMTI